MLLHVHVCVYGVVWVLFCSQAQAEQQAEEMRLRVEKQRKERMARQLLQHQAQQADQRQVDKHQQPKPKSDQEEKEKPFRKGKRISPRKKWGEVDEGSLELAHQPQATGNISDSEHTMS